MLSAFQIPSYLILQPSGEGGVVYPQESDKEMNAERIR